MRIEAYICVWNEMDILELVIKHYQKFCDEVTILDNYSTDGSRELALKMGCKVIQYGTKFFDDQENMNIKNNVWKGSKADWVIVCDCDEILWDTMHDGNYGAKSYNPIHALVETKATIFKTIGWQIMSNEMPKNDLLEITNGYEFSNYAKSIIFNPQKITEINYNPGAHKIDPMGEVVYSKDPLYVLHYKHIGGVERTIKRYREYKPRMSKLNRKHGWGSHYNRTPASLRQEWNERMLKSKPLI